MTEAAFKQQLKGTTSHTPVFTDPLKADFRNFAFAVWKFLNLPQPTVVQYDVAGFLQHGPRRMVIEAFRGVGKSWLTVAFVCWNLYRNPQMKIMVVSASAQKANEFSTFCLRLIREFPVLRHLIPGPDQRQAMVSFDVAPALPDQSPSVKSVGITGQLAGSRADIIVADDIEIPNNSSTTAKREQLLEAIKEFDAVLKPGGRVIYLGTPQTEQSIYNELPKRGYTIRIWPALFPKDPEGKLDPVTFATKKYGLRLAPSIMQRLEKNLDLAGTPTDVARFSMEDLLERRLSYGGSGFALQFQLDTSLSDAERYPLKLSDLIVHPLDPFRGPADIAWASAPELVIKEIDPIGLQGDRLYRPMWVSPDFVPYEASIMFVDPSGRGKDETSYVVLKLLHGRIYCTAAGGYVGGYDNATLTALLSIAKKHMVQRILVEPNFGAGTYVALLKSVAHQIHGVTIEDAEWVSTMKEQRIIETLEPVMNQHRLVICPSVLEADHKSVGERDVENPIQYSLMFQMTRMMKLKGALAFDDRIDALAGGVAFFSKQLARDTEQAAIQHTEGKLDAELDKFMQHVLGGPSAAAAAVRRQNLTSRVGRQAGRPGRR